VQATVSTGAITLFDTIAAATGAPILTYEVDTILTVTPCNIQVNYLKNYIKHFNFKCFSIKILNLKNIPDVNSVNTIPENNLSSIPLITKHNPEPNLSTASIRHLFKIHLNVTLISAK
jgi:hypothetical protein